MARKIHLIFKTHLDVGFTNYASVVIQSYFNKYIPDALALARQMRLSGQPERFIWTTGSWLIYEYLEQANPFQRREMEETILAGDITWHALPFTTHTELMDADLFRLGLSLSRRLDERFGRQTIAAKFTDVPGHTRAIIPLLAEAGIQFLHIGVNPGSTVPSVPPLFRWQAPGGEEIIVMYESGYGSAFVIPGIPDALAFGHTIDNSGPQSLEDVLAVYEHLRQTYPDAEIFSSSLNAFAEKLAAVRASLPVVSEEIGDTWIHGVGSDPVKVSRYRELLRLRRAWLSSNPALQEDVKFDRFQRRLLLVSEHTWGMDEKTFLGDHENYAAVDFSAARSLPNFQVFEASWAEKRAYIDSAVDALEDTPLACEARARLAAIHPRQPDLSGWQALPLANQSVDLPQASLEFDAQTGTIIHLQTASGYDWAAPDHPLVWLRYQTFSAADYERFFHQYILPSEQANGWSREDFTKPGLESANPLSRFWQPRVIANYTRENCHLFHLTGDPQAVQEYGCPQDFYLQYTFDPAAPTIQIDLQWFHKNASRLPEATWLSFRPRVSTSPDWRLDKLGVQISPLEVVENGNRHLHACGCGVSCQDENHRFSLESLDAPLVAPGEPSLLNFTNQPPDPQQGVHFNLHNNLWGTNFPMWLEDDCRFRFFLEFSA